MAEDTTKRDQTAWNIAQAYAFYVGRNVQKGFDYWFAGNIVQWFWTFKGLRELINHDLKPIEKVNLDGMEKDILKHFKHGRIMQRDKYSEKVTNYQREVMLQLKLGGFLPKKEDKTKLSF